MSVSFVDIKTLLHKVHKAIIQTFWSGWVSVKDGVAWKLDTLCLQDTIHFPPVHQESQHRKYTRCVKILNILYSDKNTYFTTRKDDAYLMHFA